MNKFEQLIEYVINDDEQKARELFHEIVVEKSREIYEDLMDEDAEEMEEGAEEMEEGFGGDSAHELIKDVEVEEEGLAEEEDEADMEFDDQAEQDGEDLTKDMEHGHDEASEEGLEDRVVDLEDKLDELMAEFEAMMGGDDSQDEMEIELEPGAGGDALAMDDTAEFQDEGMMYENVSLKAAPKPVTSEEGGINKKSTVAANAGAKGPVGNTVKPVRAGGETGTGGKHDTSAYSNTTKELIGKVGNSPAQSTQKPSAAPKPHLSQATGVNTKSPVAKS